MRQPKHGYHLSRVNTGKLLPTGLLLRTMAFAPNIFLVGPMACGKTTVGRHVAERLGREFFDSDEAVQRRTGLSVADIFAREGEKKFREYEAELIAKLTKKDGIVLATGGGAILAEENRRCLSERGTVVYLKTGVAAQLERIADDRERPLLKHGDKRATLEELGRRREKRYRQIADVTIDVDDKNVHDVADEIIAACNNDA